MDRLAQVGVAASDSDEDRVRKATLTFTSALIAVLTVIWVGAYGAVGLWLSALLAFAYLLATVTSFAAFARTKSYRFFRVSHLSTTLVAPFLVQWSLGGFARSSAVALWAVMAPLGALVFLGLRRASPWFVAFVSLVVISGLIDAWLTEAEVPAWIVIAFFVMNVLGVCTTGYLLLQYFMRARERILAELEEKHMALQAEREKSERLLLNILPGPIAARLKESPEVIADGFAAVTVLFADIVDFTPLAERLPPDEVVALLNRVFSAFDVLAQRHDLEKIKTIGDAYMLAGGLPIPRLDHAEAVAEMALDMREEAERCGREVGFPLAIRIGMDSGPVVAGVIGRSRFIYDLWGDTVNTASRMESHGLAGQIQVTRRTYEQLKRRYVLRERGELIIKGKGPMTTYFLVGRQSSDLSGLPAGPSARRSRYG